MNEMTSSYEAFYEDNYNAIYRGLTVALGDAGRAEDAAQEAFTRAYLRWRRISAMERPAAWVYVVAIREATRRTPTSRRAVAFSASENGAASVEDGVVEREVLKEAIMRLPERQRVAIALRYLADLSLVDVATAMHCAVGTAKSTVHAALAQLHVALDCDTEVEEDDNATR